MSECIVYQEKIAILESIIVDLKADLVELKTWQGYDKWETIKAENKRLQADLAARNRKLRGIEHTFKLWAGTINPDYKKICIQIQQILKEPE